MRYRHPTYHPTLSDISCTWKYKVSLPFNRLPVKCAVFSTTSSHSPTLKGNQRGFHMTKSKVTHGSGCSEEVPFQNKPLAHPSQCSITVGQTTGGSAQMTNEHKHGSGHWELMSLRLNILNSDLQIFFIPGCYKNKSWPRITNHIHIMMWRTVRKHWCNVSTLNHDFKSHCVKQRLDSWCVLKPEHVSETLTLDKTNMFVYPTLYNLRLK